jgi:hypothetical protein
VEGHRFVSKGQEHRESRSDVGHIRLIHWNTDEAQERALLLKELGYDVAWESFDRDTLRTMRGDPPQAVVIDLSRLPSHGRDVAINIRSYKATRGVPLVFVGGQTNKVDKIEALLPDAVYTTWEDIGEALEEAIAHPPAKPVVPGSVMDAYAGTPLPKKLGIKAGAVVSLVNAPPAFETALGDGPEDVRLSSGIDLEADLTLWFTTSRHELETGIERMASLAHQSGLWIFWPKKSSGVESDLSQNVVREVALAAGLVDFKVCSVDETWSGLRFTQRSS